MINLRILENPMQTVKSIAQQHTAQLVKVRDKNIKIQKHHEKSAEEFLAMAALEQSKADAAESEINGSNLAISNIHEMYGINANR